MKGAPRACRQRPLSGAGRSAAAIAFNDKCDVVVATVTADADLARGARRRCNFSTPNASCAGRGSELGSNGSEGDCMKSAVIVFPGINRERDMARALKLISGREPAMVWHAETRTAGRHRSRRHSRRLLLWRLFALRRDRGARADYGRGARLSPRKGGLVLAVCNGFQIACEAGLLPGVLMRNAQLRFICRDVYLRVERSDTRIHARLQCRPGDPGAGGARRGQLHRRRRDHRAARRRGQGAVPLFVARRHDRSELEPQRRHERHRRHHQ